MTDHRFLQRLRETDLLERTGRVLRILPTYVECDGPNVERGALCEIETRSPAGGKAQPTLAEVVSISRDSVVLVPLEGERPTFSGARVVAREGADKAPVGDGYLGRVVDPLGRPLDGGPAIHNPPLGALRGIPTSPLLRSGEQRPLETGLRTIDGLMTLGVGQRVGVFAASGVGKTSLLTQLAQQTNADRCVICLVGERGREVEALWSEGLSPTLRSRTTVVAATSDQTAAMRVRAGDYALALAEYWRAQGLHVLLILDSVTRLAMAMRETGLAAGEPPTVRAYTPSVFAAIPKLVERCGGLKGGGAITAIMSVLSETDDVDDPISEMMKSLLDGHLILSRSLAEQGHFPAIDAPRSISRLANLLAAPSHRAAAEAAIAVLSTYEASRTLIETGVYVRGANADIDRALDLRPALLAFMKQGLGERTPFRSSCEQLVALVGRRT